MENQSKKFPDKIMFRTTPEQVAAIEERARIEGRTVSGLLRHYANLILQGHVQAPYVGQDSSHHRTTTA
ncbi:MAG: hypothetical protein SH809_02540 [Rhodothermales bacterium]|nr:hypothetical protein [Rhodothermales bacterium]